MEGQILNEPITTFLEGLASNAPTPGGGSAAALGGALAAALISMVCNLTIGKQRFADVEGTMRDLLDRAESLRHELQGLVQEDIEVFNRLSAAYKLPRVTESDTAIRRDAIQNGIRRAAEVPLRTARASAALLALCGPAAEYGNPTVVSDVGVAVHLANAAVRSALLNVDINLRVLEDQRYAREVRAEVDRLTDSFQPEVERVVNLVAAKIKG